MISDPGESKVVQSASVDNRHIRFSLDRAEVDLDQLVMLFNRNAFWAQDRQREELERAIQFSNPVTTVWDGEVLIGFARATSDSVYRAVIWDVVIDEGYQNQGLGRKLVQTLISHPDMSKVERVYLFTTHQQAFYKRIGFMENTSTTLVLMGKTLEFVLPAEVSLATSTDEV